MKRLLICLLLANSLGCGKKETAETPSVEPGTAQPGTAEETVGNTAAPTIDLLLAAVSGDTEVIKQHVAAGTQLDQRSQDGQQNTALMIAATFGQLETARVLIDARVQLDLQNKDGNTALFISSFLCHTEIVQALLEAGANPNITNKDNATALNAVTAAWNDIKPIYDIVNDLIFLPSGMPLDYAFIQNTRPRVAQLLSKSGGKAAGPGKPQATAKPALRTWKDASGQFSIEATLVRVDGDKVVLQRKDQTEMTLPISALSTADRQYIQERPASSTNADLITAVTTGNLAVLKQHIAAGANLDQRAPDAPHPTLLILASVFGQTAIAQALVDGGAQLDLQDKDGSTALMAAAFFCHPDIVQLLLKKGADKNIKNNMGNNALSTVEAPFDTVKYIYDIVDGAIFKPAGVPLDYARIKATRPKIVEMLR